MDLDFLFGLVFFVCLVFLGGGGNQPQRPENYPKEIFYTIAFWNMLGNTKYDKVGTRRSFAQSCNLCAHK